MRSRIDAAACLRNTRYFRLLASPAECTYRQQDDCKRGFNGKVIINSLCELRVCQLLEAIKLKTAIESFHLFYIGYKHVISALLGNTVISLLNMLPLSGSIIDSVLKRPFPPSSMGYGRKRKYLREKYN